MLACALACFDCAGGAPDVAALQCEMEGASGDVAGDMAAMAGSHHGESVEHPAEHEHPDSSPLDCGLLMSCGTTAVSTAEGVRSDGADTPEDSGFAAYRNALGVILAFDPPPPRAHV